MKKAFSLFGLLAIPALAHAGGLAVTEQNAVSAGTAGAGAARRALIAPPRGSNDAATGVYNCIRTTIP